ncbi:MULTISPECIES: diadenylate cyclase CdaA [Dethiosulfovibrio]|jgi:diadenylate cyclase|uniref:Diadenylate cyclase n=2 Tax=Dethiosulfovibrio TaxID=47054 RepID=A0ABS9EQ99_9BACT|nr:MULTISPECIES: diadenylate cyclase CdaA [Dethiosulfovibrio]MCF4115038.1 diadenylate cyclase CdaA [Dethiosulfovibrio russensis]MCF4143361.1 diadenylate cyclase CdaA [Dethiosulfovibrio marinus]MCF4145520.1 diadenylate cyclase CdaA [Dethiosulfovibrio acidaminovorans]
MTEIFKLIRWQDVVDILVIYYVVYRLLSLLYGTRAMQLVKGLLVIGILATSARLLNLETISWFMGQILNITVIAVPIVFQPELRKVLEELGRGNIWKRHKAQKRAETIAGEISKALIYMKGQRIGALLVLQRGTGLKDFWRTAIELNADITQELLISIFWVNNPLHDGAVILDQSKIIAAGCYLPLTEDSDLSRWIGTRHRAGLGVTEVSDAISLIVSEERGEVSLAINGHLSRNLKDDQVHKLLVHYFSGEDTEQQSFLDTLRDEIKSLGS